MITKVAYKPYASGVNSTQRQTQPQNVNFGANPQNAQKTIVQGIQLLGTLSSLYSVGKNKAENILPDMLRNLPAVLRKVGAPKLAESFKAEIKGLKDPQILERLKRTEIKRKPETLLEIIAALLHAGASERPADVLNLTQSTVAVLEKNGAKEQAVGLGLAAKVLDIDALIHMTDREVMQAKDPWLAGVMQEFVRRVREE